MKEYTAELVLDAKAELGEGAIWYRGVLYWVDIMAGRVNVYDPAGTQVTTEQTTPAESSVQLPVTTGDVAGGIWSVVLTQADEGVSEDRTIYLDPALPQALSLHPAHVFGTDPTD